MKLEGLSFIGMDRGEGGPHSFTAVNPAAGEPLPTRFYRAFPEEIGQAARLAARAFADFSRWSGARRAAFLQCIAELLEANAGPIVERAHLETALPAARLQNELARTCFQLRFYGEAAANGLLAAARIDHGDPQRRPQPRPDVRSMLRPVGPVAVFGASNFPLAYSVAGGDTASALAAGCTVIVKAHPAHPGTSELVGALILQAARTRGAPDGVFSLLFDDGYEVGATLVRHPLVQAVGFTGSRRGGRTLMDLAAARPEPIPVFAEMGSVNPVFVLPGALNANAQALATGFHGSVTLGVGQFCTNPGLAFVGKGDPAEAFLQRLESLMTATPPGVMLTAGLCGNYWKGVDNILRTGGVRAKGPGTGEGIPSPDPKHSEKSGRSQGVLPKIQSGDARLSRKAAGAALFVTEGKVFLENRHLMDEVFGPSTLVVQCDSDEQMLAAARQLEGQLTATIHGTPEDLTAHRELLAVLETKAGRLVFNGYPTGVEVCHAMVHGGPYPSTSDGRSTSVGTRAMERFLRPVAYQNFSDAALPEELKEANPLGLWRLVDGSFRQH